MYSGYMDSNKKKRQNKNKKKSAHKIIMKDLLNSNLINLS